MQCKQVLEEADGDIDKALTLLKKKGAEITLKKSGRNLGSGVIASYIHSDHSLGVLVELLCETDFVAKNKEFRALADDIAMHVAAMNPKFIKEEEKMTDEEREKVLLNQSFVKEPELSIQDLIERATQKMGERIEISRFLRYRLLAD